MVSATLCIVRTVPGMWARWCWTWICWFWRICPCMCRPTPDVRGPHSRPISIFSPTYSTLCCSVHGNSTCHRDGQSVASHWCRCWNVVKYALFIAAYCTRHAVLGTSNLSICNLLTILTTFRRKLLHALRPNASFLVNLCGFLESNVEYITKICFLAEWEKRTCSTNVLLEMIVFVSDTHVFTVALLLFDSWCPYRKITRGRLRLDSPYCCTMYTWLVRFWIEFMVIAVPFEIKHKQIHFPSIYFI